MSSSSPRRTATLRVFEFEDLVADLFERQGFDVQREVRVGGFEVDLLIERDGRRSVVEVSAMSPGTSMAKIRADAERLRALQTIETEITNPIIVVASELTPKAKAWAEQQYGLEVWDSRTLSQAAMPFPEIAQRLELFGKAPAASPRKASEDETNVSLQKTLADHIRENTLSPSEYETLCMSAFAHLFDPHLYGFKPQAKTTDGGNRYDFICRIQPGDPFWDSVRQDFRTKAILFECKNYNDQIGPDQIYSTERYLFSGALRTVCILTSRLGASDAAIRAAQGAMRETGKLIILLSNADLIEMLKLRPQERAAEDFLDKRIWDFIVSLPR